MDVTFRLEEAFPGNSDLVQLGNDLLMSGGHWPSANRAHVAQNRASSILDAMGELSARAQGLRAPVTSGSKMRPHDEQTAYLLLDRPANAVVGLLKVGKKNLFLCDKVGAAHEAYPLCVLDFYVHESRQRSGCGKLLFERMLADQKVSPRFLAVDRPSSKLLAFLKKHYGLFDPIRQSNNYVVFDGFFDSGRPFEANPGPRRARIYMGKLQYV